MVSGANTLRVSASTLVKIIFPAPSKEMEVFGSNVETGPGSGRSAWNVYEYNFPSLLARSTSLHPLQVALHFRRTGNF